MRTWASDLLNVRESGAWRLSKIKAAIAITLKGRVIWPAIKIAALKTKQIGWDNRGRTARLFTIVSAVSVGLFGGQNAGIAALGTAVAVPIWVVLGSGAAFANLLIEEISRRNRSQDDVITTYTVIDADFVKRVD